MKKKLLIFLFAIVAVFACVLGFAGCDLFDTADNTDGDDVSDCAHTMTKVSAKAATCTEAGNIEYWYCNSCNNYYTDAVGNHKTTASNTTIAKKGHAEVVDAAVAATCTKSGKTEGKHCLICNTVIVAQQTIPASHTIVIDYGFAASCHSGGKTDGKHCSVCNTVIEPQRTIPSSHKEVIDEAVAATCTTDGKTEGKHCSVCNEVIIAQQTISAGHTEVTDAAVSATCTTDGKTQGVHCSVCNTVIVAQQTIPARHTEVTDAAVEVTCTTDGKTEGKHCSVCNTVIVAQQVIHSSGHNRVTDTAVEATCAQAGKTAGEHCSVCNTVFTAQQTIAKLAHSGSGNLCSVCGGLRVAASTGLEFTALTAMPYWYPSSASARSVEIIGYEVKSKGSFNGTNLIIPETHEGLPVLGIASSAFQNNTTIKSLTVPNGVLYIDNYAFGYCSNLSAVNIADSVTHIKDGSFRATKITTFKCPKNLTEVTSKMFVNCTSLKTVIINASVKKMDVAAFGDNPALTDIYFEGSLAQWDSASRSNWYGNHAGGWDGVYQWNNVTYSITVSIYSETMPDTVELLLDWHYWHYVNGVPTKWN